MSGDGELEAQLEGRLEELDRMRASDPRAARIFARYLARRAELLPIELRARASAALADDAPASEEERTSAERYAEIRCALFDLAQRAKEARGQSGRGVDAAIDSHRNAAGLRKLTHAAYAIALLCLASGCLYRGDFGVLLVVLGLLAGMAGGCASWVARFAMVDACAHSERVDDELATEQMAREARDARDALLASDEGRWLRQLVAAHPQLAFDEVAAPGSPYRNGPARARA